MKLSELFSNIEVLKMSPKINMDLNITGIAYDSRMVRNGDLFVTWKGTHSDGMLFVEEALGRGAAALCLEKGEDLKWKVPTWVVQDARQVLSHLARNFYHDPSQYLKVIGITGTNGKTSVGFLTQAIFNEAGRHPGLLGTVHYEIGNRRIPSERTTPESLQLQAYLREMLDDGCKICVIEVSSHALDQKRVQGINFEIGIFTNLSQDHLDYHQNLEQYFWVKAILFQNLSKQAFAVINSDDAYGQRLLKMTKAQVVTYGMSRASMIHADRVRLGTRGSSCEIIFPGGKVDLNLNLMGGFNIYNVLAAFSAGWALGIHSDVMRNALENFKGVPGRMEFIETDMDFDVIVDYAHTQDALEKVLRALRPLTKNRLISVFGCGGDRDKGKRPKMGAVACQNSDLVILTSDNPRSEDPLEIIHQIEDGIKMKDCRYEVILDRKTAIEFALNSAKRGDLVLIAGKGHEKFQEIGFLKIPFDDGAIVKETLRSLKNLHSLQKHR